MVWFVNRSYSVADVCVGGKHSYSLSLSSFRSIFSLRDHCNETEDQDIRPGAPNPALISMRHGGPRELVELKRCPFRGWGGNASGEGITLSLDILDIIMV